MIEARKSTLFSQLFHFYNLRLLRKTFKRIYLKQEATPLPSGPTLYLANHSSWWDGLIAFYLTKTTIEQDCYAMMTEDGLKSYPFFRKLGGYSINKDNPKDVIKSLAYTKSLLESSKGVWIFPQGKEEHLEKRPLVLQPGVNRIINEVSNLTVVPVTFYYTFLHEQQPELFITLGKKIPKDEFERFSDKKEITSFLELVVTEQLNKQKSEIIAENLGDYQVVFQGNRTVSEKFKAMKGH